MLRLLLVGAPYVQRLPGNRGMSAALTGITAAVVGVIANLALFFSAHTLFGTVDQRAWGPVSLAVPDLTTLHPLAPG